MTQEQLAARLGSAGLHHFDRVTVAKIEGQIRSVFDYELAVIADVLRVELGDLFQTSKKLKDAAKQLQGVAGDCCRRPSRRSYCWP